MAVLIAGCWGCRADAQTSTTLEVSETLFSVVAAANVCGYDQGLSTSLPVRAQVRSDLVAASKSPEVAEAAKAMCAFYEQHRRGGASQVLPPYISLALNLGDPPKLTPKVAEADMPPDAAYVLGFTPLLRKYAAAANLHDIWLKHQEQYQALVNQYHEPVSQMISGTDNYLRIPIAVYADRKYIIYLEPMAAPGEVDSRNYQSDYFYIVDSPTRDKIRLQEMRHTYLHFALEPLLAKRATSLNRLKPILASVKNAPLDAPYKTDVGLLLLESLIRAIEARVPLDPKLPEKDRLAKVSHDEQEGFILTGYFYDQLKTFEKESMGLKEAFPNWLHDLAVDKVIKQASQIQFASTAEPEVMRTDASKTVHKVDLAEKALASGNPAGAAQLAEEALAANEDQGRCYFVLARAASITGNMQDAKDNFGKAVAASGDVRVVAWSHIYLGRILDLQDERESAVEQYKAALSAGDSSADTRSAAERGLQSPYEPPSAPQVPKSN